MNYHEIEAEYPELSTIKTWSVEWYERFRVLHLAKYPDVDQGTRDNLAMFVDRAKALESQFAPGARPPAAAGDGPARQGAEAGREGGGFGPPVTAAFPAQPRADSSTAGVPAAPPRL